MAVKNYYFRFGTGNPSTYSGLSPTFIVFRSPAGATTPPSISELSTTGVYNFQYECTGSVAFVVDGATTLLTTADRYIAGALDVSDRLDEFLGRAGDAIGFSTAYGQILQAAAYGLTGVALGTTSVAIGTSLVAIGTTNFALGTTNVAIGTSNIALGTSILAQGVSTLALIGTATDTIGDSVSEPNTLFGFIRRCENVLEGQSAYVKATGVLTLKDKTGQTTLATRTIADSTSSVTKS